jgi:hypothetical protein
MRKVAWSVFTSAFFLAVANADARNSLYSRNLFCWRFSAGARASNMRGSAAGDGVDLDGTGHAIVAPSFRVTFDTVKKFIALFP